MKKCFRGEIKWNLSRSKSSILEMEERKKDKNFFECKSLSTVTIRLTDGQANRRSNGPSWVYRWRKNTQSMTDIQLY